MVAWYHCHASIDFVSALCQDTELGMAGRTIIHMCYRHTHMAKMEATASRCSQEHSELKPKWGRPMKSLERKRESRQIKPCIYLMSPDDGQNIVKMLKLLQCTVRTKLTHGSWKQIIKIILLVSCPHYSIHHREYQHNLDKKITYPWPWKMKAFYFSWANVVLCT